MSQTYLLTASSSISTHEPIDSPPYSSLGLDNSFHVPDLALNSISTHELIDPPPYSSSGLDDSTPPAPPTANLAPDLFEAEKRGYEYEIAAQLTNVGLDDPIADDDWEYQDKTDDEVDEVGGTDGTDLTNIYTDITIDAAASASTSETSNVTPDEVSSTQTHRNGSYIPEALPAGNIPAPEDVHPATSVYVIYLLVLWLHTMFHVPFHASRVQCHPDNSCPSCC